MKTASLLRLLGSTLLLIGSLSALAKPRPDSVDVFMQRVMQRHHIPGAAVAVVRGGKVIKQQTYGLAHLGWQAPVTPQTAFQIASVAKPLTSTLLGVLVQEGKLKLEAPIGTYLDSIPAAWQSLTVRELAAHQSGIKLVPLETTRDFRHARQQAALLPLDFEPGSKEFYVSSDYGLLQAIIERVTGLSYEQALRQKVLQPLGMKNAQFSYTTDEGLFRKNDIVAQASQVYSWDKTTQQYRSHEMRYPAWYYAAGGVFASIQDMTNWALGLDKATVLQPATMATLWAPAELRNHTKGEFGLGWTTETYHGHPIVGHSGGPTLADVIRFLDGPEPLTIIVLTNARTGFPPYLAKAVAHYFVPKLLQDRPENYQ
ncbi:serine hydrolase domain-containing protein [Hymenobacter guriensis]|uniref:Beta-lactamase family protein n=1 Tax=Hymenobacter guriensis TaxID=2793065 RepID=A0ABS0L2G4_9BACT|nr:serine hydrolase domain-containing protein [Hymenobacter guriensis]MBG8554300.1 beta-lactamase family protein [Hymenobacter guriensis]